MLSHRRSPRADSQGRTMTGMDASARDVFGRRQRASARHRHAEEGRHGRHCCKGAVDEDGLLPCGGDPIDFISGAPERQGKGCSASFADTSLV